MNFRITCKLASIMLISLWTAFCYPGQSSAQQMTPQEIRGKQIYLKGTSPSGNNTRAIVGKRAMEMPGEALTCVSCHGFDGRGLSEHGIEATSITWEDLTKTYVSRRDIKREYPPYNEATLVRAIVEGIDPGGNILDVSMPRYRMVENDLNDLIAYLKVIATVLDPGLTDDRIRLGTVLPSHGVFGEMGRLMQAIMNAYFSEINEKGGIFNRKIEMVAADHVDTPESIVAALRKLIDEDQVFAVVSPFTMGADKEAAGFVEISEVPMIGPFTLFPEDIYALKRYTFYLLSGLREQARAQVAYSGKLLKSSDPRIAVVYPEMENNQEIAEAVEMQANLQGWISVEKLSYLRAGFDPSQMVNSLKNNKTEAIFFLGPWEHLQSVFGEAERLQWFPFIFMSGAQIKKEVFQISAGFTKKIFITYPTLPDDQTPDGIREMRNILKKYELPGKHMAAQISALCAAKILVEGMKLAGGKLSREKLVSALDTLYKFETNLIPPVSYDPNRRVGALGSHVVTIDIEKKTVLPTGPWINLE